MLPARPLEAGDRAGVEELARHTYAGHDWITSCFDKWVRQPLSEGIALVVPDADGKVAALECARLIDGGTRVWLEALRVHPGAHLAPCRAPPRRLRTWRAAPRPPRGWHGASAAADAVSGAHATRRCSWTHPTGARRLER